MTDNIWTEIKVNIPAAFGEIIAELFMEEGAGGVIYDDPGIIDEYSPSDDEYFGKEIAAVTPEAFGLRVYFPRDGRLDERLIRLKERIGAVLGYPPEFGFQEVREEDWAESWKTYFKPERIGNIVIKPSWEAYQPTGDEMVVELDPGMAFGTGTHPTTRLCLLLLQEIGCGKRNLLDIGTGSGILAVAGAKLGIREIVATDIDPMAVKIAAENAARNGVEQAIHAIESDLLEGKLNRRFELVVANIISNAILKIIPNLPQVMEKEGYFLASGIIEERFPEIRRSLIARGFSIERTLTEDGWVGVAAIFNPPGQKSR
ncbi:MAG: 50S ribosomal protein L11 methyltransferase [Firmicutes bacterium]|nr:50S ribosomal protein L11 methyltransferase [Bacillota bacterium]